MVSIRFEELPDALNITEGILNWRSTSLTPIELIETKLIGYKTVQYANKLININDDKFSEEHPILIYDGNEYKFVQAFKVQEGWMILDKIGSDLSSLNWVPVTNVSVEENGGVVYLFACDPEHIIFTQHMAVHNTKPPVPPIA